MSRKILLVLGLLASMSVNAAVVFSDNFNKEIRGNNKTPSAGWTVTDGTVDIIGYGSWKFFPAYGNYVDLDGSTSNAGILAHAFNLIGGKTYEANYELAGGQRRPTEINKVTVTFGSSSEDYKFLYNDVFKNFSLRFTPTVSGTYQLSFANAGGDNVGALLDNVSVNSVPLPAAAWLFLSSMLGMLGLRRKAV